MHHKSTAHILLQFFHKQLDRFLFIIKLIMMSHKHLETLTLFNSYCYNISKLSQSQITRFPKPWNIIFVRIMHLPRVKVVSHTFVRRGVPVREDTYPEPSACEVGWPVPFIAAFISPVFHWVPVGCWVNSEQAFSQGIESGSSRRPAA